ncbi:MAG: hypothetical protein MUD08_12560 [Cytophagales bacterium]|jgi:hypothetical protein|nr:hypothetical protein [Cytophagales bacterium]
MKTQTLPSATVSVQPAASNLLDDVIDLHKVRSTLYAKIAASTDDSLLKTFFQHMANDSRRFRTELCLFSRNHNADIADNVVRRIENVWERVGCCLSKQDTAGLLQAWKALEEIMIDAYLKVAANTGIRGNFRKLVLKQIDSLRKDRNVYRFVESVFPHQLQF